MNKNKILSGGGKNLTGGGKSGWRGREVGGEGEGSGVKGEGSGDWVPPVHPLNYPEQQSGKGPDYIQKLRKQKKKRKEH